MTDFSKNFFSNMPFEFAIPKSAKVVFVSDFFVKDVSGGAELTSEAILSKSPFKVFKLHSASVTQKMVEANLDKYWIFGNFAALKDPLIQYLPDSGIKYSMIEYDFKFCSFRSTNRHQQQMGTPCNCAHLQHGMNVTRFFQKADRIFWMSEGQKTHWLKNVESLVEHPGHVILSSVFDDEVLDFISSLREKVATQASSSKWATLGSGSWIKGIEETQKWCKLNRKDTETIPSLPYRKFLETLSQYQGFIFRPLDRDTCPRVTIEAKLIGMNLILNENVLQKDDAWFTQDIKECEAYLRSRASFFWTQLPVVTV